MKNVIAGLIFVATLALSSNVVAEAPQTQLVVAPSKPPSSVIDGIEVPYEVLEYAQMQNQGYAVTKVVRSSRDGKPAYQLRVDNDDQLYDDNCIFLWYGMDWKLLGESKANALISPFSNIKRDTDVAPLVSEPTKPDEGTQQHHTPQPDTGHQSPAPSQDGTPQDPGQNPIPRHRAPRVPNPMPIQEPSL